MLGSDVNFFLDSAPLAVCRGRGELVEPQPLRGPLWFVVVKPDIGLSTAAVFQQLDLSRCGRAACGPLLDSCRNGDVGQIATLLANDLESPSRALSADLQSLLDRLGDAALLGSRMTGSGSACFGVATNRLHADRAARRLLRERIGDVFVVRTAV
jgi:4-diphosphocytidyl-2-C-methyl-D-erythritol kinase